MKTYLPKVRTPGVSCAHKAEMQNAQLLTNHRLYLIPITVKAITTFNQYNFDITVAGANPNFDIKCAIYEQVNKISSTSVTATLVSGTSVTSNGLTASFRTVNLGANFTLLPGSYWIAFIYDDNLTTTLTSNNSTRAGTWYQQRWVYNDPGSFTLPTTITGSNLSYIAAAEYPIWGAVVYTGDTMP